MKDQQSISLSEETIDVMLCTDGKTLITSRLSEFGEETISLNLEEGGSETAFSSVGCIFGSANVKPRVVGNLKTRNVYRTARAEDALRPICSPTAPRLSGILELPGTSRFITWSNLPDTALVNHFESRMDPQFVAWARAGGPSLIELWDDETSARICFYDVSGSLSPSSTPIGPTPWFYLNAAVSMDGKSLVWCLSGILSGLVALDTRNWLPKLIGPISTDEFDHVTFSQSGAYLCAYSSDDGNLDVFCVASWQREFRLDLGHWHTISVGPGPNELVISTKGKVEILNLESQEVHPFVKLEGDITYSDYLGKAFDSSHLFSCSYLSDSERSRFLLKVKI